MLKITKIILLSSLMMFSASAFASMCESCNYDVTVKNMTGQSVVLNFIQNHGGGESLGPQKALSQGDTMEFSASYHPTTSWSATENEFSASYTERGEENPVALGSVGLEFSVTPNAFKSDYHYKVVDLHPADPIGQSDCHTVFQVVSSSTKHGRLELDIESQDSSGKACTL